MPGNNAKWKEKGCNVCLMRTLGIEYKIKEIGYSFAMIYTQLMQSTIDNAILILEKIKTSRKTSSLLKVYLPKKDEEVQQTPKKKKLF